MKILNGFKMNDAKMNGFLFIVKILLVTGLTIAICY